MRGSLLKKKEHDRDKLPGNQRVQNYKQRRRNDKIQDQLEQRNSKQPLCRDKYQDKEESSGKSVMNKEKGMHTITHSFIHLLIHAFILSCIMHACIACFFFCTYHGQWSGQRRRGIVESTLQHQMPGCKAQLQTGSSWPRVYPVVVSSQFCFKMLNRSDFIPRK